jgi:hypothetical protein
VDKHSSLTAWFGSDLIEHILAAQRFGNAFGRVLGERMFGIGAGDLEDAVVEHHYSEQTESHARRDQNLIHVVDAKAAGLFDPILDEGIAQSMFGLRLGKIRAFDNETIFAHFFGLFE